MSFSFLLRLFNIQKSMSSFSCCHIISSAFRGRKSVDCNNASVAFFFCCSMMNAFSEGLSLADKSGLSPQTLLDVLVLCFVMQHPCCYFLYYQIKQPCLCFDLQDLGAIANPMFKMKGPSMLQGSHNPAFPLKHQQKDMRLALSLGDENAVSMPVAAAANEVCPPPPYLQNITTKLINTRLRTGSQAFKKARSLGLGDLDFSAVHEVLKGTGGSG